MRLPKSSPASESSFISSAETVARMTTNLKGILHWHNWGFGLRLDCVSCQKCIMDILYTMAGKMSSKNFEQGCGMKNYFARSNMGEIEYGERWKVNKVVIRLLKCPSSDITVVT